MVTCTWSKMFKTLMANSRICYELCKHKVTCLCNKNHPYYKNSRWLIFTITINPRVHTHVSFDKRWKQKWPQLDHNTSISLAIDGVQEVAIYVYLYIRQ